MVPTHCGGCQSWSDGSAAISSPGPDGVEVNAMAKAPDGVEVEVELVEFVLFGRETYDAFLKAANAALLPA